MLLMYTYHVRERGGVEEKDMKVEGSKRGENQSEKNKNKFLVVCLFGTNMEKMTSWSCWVFGDGGRE